MTKSKLLDLRAAWHDHRDPVGYRVEYVYDESGEGHVVALRLVRLSDDEHVGDLRSVADLLDAAA